MPKKSLESAEKKGRFLVDVDKWQKMESLSVKTCQEVQKRTENPLIKMIAEIIRRDSESHIEVLKHGYHKIEQKSVEIAQEAIRDSRLFEIRYLLTYLLEDESKHLKLLDQLDDFKRNLFPYR
jgi:hypothetical protein